MEQKKKTKRSLKMRITLAGFLGMLAVAVIILGIIVPNITEVIRDANKNYLFDQVKAYGKQLNYEVMSADDPQDVLGNVDLLAAALEEAGMDGLETSYAFVVDADGIMLYHPTADRIGTSTTNEMVIEALDEMNSGTIPEPALVSSYVDRTNKYLAYYAFEDGSGMLCIVANEDEFMEEAHHLVNIAVIAGVVGLLLFSVVGYFTAMKLTNPVVVVTERMRKMGKLDFTDDGTLEPLVHNVDETADMARALINLNDELVDTIKTIQDQSKVLYDSSAELQNGTNETTQTFGNIESAVNDIAQGATSQANETQAATDNVVVIGDMIEATKEQVDILNTTAQEISESNAKASDALEQLTQINKQTIESIAEIEQQTRTTNESAAKIKDAALLIANIAEETNLLSLNASIEAARAGEAGRGFAVVASQIQKLAEQSNQSAQQIDEVVRTLIADSDKSVETMQEVTQIVQKQSEYLESTEEMFENVRDGIKDSVTGIKNIATKTVELNEARSNIIDTVQSLTAIAEENAAGTEETSASVTQVDAIMKDIAENAITLKNIAQTLEENVEKFII